MTTDGSVDEIVVTEDGTTLSTIDVLTGRAFLTGKSGSGKSNTCGVVVEELLDRGFNLLVVDTEGEYASLTDRYDVLHVGGDEFADLQVDPSDAADIAERSMDETLPVVLDVSGYDDPAVAEDLIEGVVDALFRIEKRERTPYLLVVEEIQEYLPQRGGGGDLATLLERVAKRGRKRGLGLCGVSQRPSAVDKEFVTQCDWMVWHRLTWQNDLEVVRGILGPERAEAVTTFDPGEAFLMADWLDSVRRVRFRRKRTRDVGATPGLDRYDDREAHAAGAPDRGDAGDEPEPGSARDGGTGGDPGPARGDDKGGAAVERGELPADHADGTDDDADGTDDATDGSTGPGPPPTAPPRTGEHTDVGGALMEAGALTVYLCRWTAYRARCLLHRLGNG